MKSNILTEKQWLKIYGYCKSIARDMETRLPEYCYWTAEDLYGYVMDAAIKCVGSWKPGESSPESYVWKWAGKIAWREVRKELARLEKGLFGGRSWDRLEDWEKEARLPNAKTDLFESICRREEELDLESDLAATFTEEQNARAIKSN